MSKNIYNEVFEVLTEAAEKPSAKTEAALVVIKDKKEKTAELYEEHKNAKVGDKISGDGGKTYFIVFGKVSDTLQLVIPGGSGATLWMIKKDGSSDFVYIENRANLKKYL